MQQSWKEILLPSGSFLEVIVRGSVMYLFLFALLRFTLKRESGVLGVTDLLVIVLIADASQNAMIGDHKSVGDGWVLVATIMFWAYSLEWIGFHFPRLGQFVNPPPLLLISDGQMHRRNMRRELITEDELKSQLRLQGIDDLAEVKRAYMEPDGRISAVRYSQESRGPDKKRTA